MKFLDILQTASSNMMRSKMRSILTIIAIFIGALTLTLTNGIGAGVSTYIDDQLGNLGAEDVLMVQVKSEQSIGGVQEYNPERTTSSGTSGAIAIPVLTDSDIETIGQIPGILSIEPGVSATPDFIQGRSDKKFQLTTQPFIDGTNPSIDEGHAPDNASEDYEIVLAPAYVEVLGFGSAAQTVGQKVTIGITSGTGEQQLVTATVVGVQQQTLISSISGAQVNKALNNGLRQIQIEGLPPAQSHQYLAAITRVSQNISDEDLQTIKDALDEKGFTGVTIQDQIGIFKQVIDAIVMVLNFFAAIALLAASFGIVNTLLMAVQERTKEIGLMKAMGMRSSRVFMLFSIEAILLGFWGSLLGSLAGIGLGKLVNNIAANSFLKDLPGFDLMSFPLTSVLAIMLIIMAIAFIAGTLPARRASKKDPIEALRYE